MVVGEVGEGDKEVKGGGSSRLWVVALVGLAPSLNHHFQALFMDNVK